MIPTLALLLAQAAQQTPTDLLNNPKAPQIVHGQNPEPAAFRMDVRPSVCSVPLLEAAIDKDKSFAIQKFKPRGNPDPDLATAQVPAPPCKR